MWLKICVDISQTVETRELLAEIRRRVPGIHIPHDVMVGFPGEGEKEFVRNWQNLSKEQRFERMVSLAYCVEEDNLRRKSLYRRYPDEVKQNRVVPSDG